MGVWAYGRIGVSAYRRIGVPNGRMGIRGAKRWKDFSLGWVCEA